MADRKNSRKIDGVKGIRSRKDYRKAVASARKAVIVILGLNILVFAAIIGLVAADGGLGSMMHALETMNAWYFAAALAVIFFSYSIRYPKWSLYLRRLGVHIRTARSYVIYLSMYSMDMTPGRWGRAVASYTINRLSNVKFARTFPAVVADIFTDFLGFAIVTDVSAIIVGKFIVISFILTLLLMVPFFFVYVERPFIYVKKKFLRIRRRFRIARKLDTIFSTATLYFEHNKKLGVGAFAYSMLLTVPSMFLNGMALYLTMMAFGVPLGLSDIPVVLFIFSSSIVIGIITGIPAAVGITDAALIGQLSFFFPSSINLGLASVITIFFRIASIWFVQAFGFVAFLYTLRYWEPRNPIESSRQGASSGYMRA